MLKIKSREYKAMLDRRLFAGGKDSMDDFWKDVQRVAGKFKIRAEGQFDGPEKRTIEFLDTPDFTLRRNHLLLRRRESESGRCEFTLKCRIEDRYLAGGMDLRPNKGHKARRKFEEDIAPPFRCRFSQSSSIIENIESPRSVGEAAELYPILGMLQRDGSVCDGATPMVIVGGIRARERVYKGPRLRIGPKGSASIALIVWSSTWKGRLLAAEFSFRYGHGEEQYGLKLVQAARSFYIALQRLAGCLPGEKTKTEVVYAG